MPTFKHMTGVSTGGAYLATVTGGPDHIKIAPLQAGSGIPTLMATKEIPMPTTVAYVLRKCGIEPPADGSKLTVADVDKKMLAQSISLQDRISTKQQLSRAGLI